MLTASRADMLDPVREEDLSTSYPDDVLRRAISFTRDGAVDMHPETEAKPIMVSYKPYSSVNRPFYRTFSSPFSRQYSFTDSKMYTYFSSFTNSLQIVSQTMFFPGAIGDAFSFRTLSLSNVPSKDRSISSLLVFVSTLNMIIAPSMFALPFLAARAGASILVAIVVIGALTLYTSLLVHTCQYQTSKTQPGLEKRVYCSYIDLGKVALKPYGESAMLVLLYTNLFADMTSVALLGLLTMSFFSNPFEITRQLGVVVWAALILPLLLFVKKSILSWIATAGMIGYLGAIVVVYFELITTCKSWKVGNLHLSYDWEYFFIGYGIILQTFNCHILLPATEACAKKPENFRSLLKASFSVNIVMKFVLAAMGVAAYGVGTSLILLPNMKSFGIFNAIVIVLIVIYLYSNRPRSILVVAELMDNHVQPKLTLMQKETKGHFVWLFISRSILLLTLVFLAVVIPRIDLVIALSGCIRGTANAVVCPLAFYLRLNGRRISKLSYAAHVALLVMALIVGFLGTAIVIKAMILGKK